MYLLSRYCFVKWSFSQLKDQASNQGDQELPAPELPAQSLIKPSPFPSPHQRLALVGEVTTSSHSRQPKQWETRPTLLGVEDATKSSFVASSVDSACSSLGQLVPRTLIPDNLLPSIRNNRDNVLFPSQKENCFYRAPHITSVLRCSGCGVRRFLERARTKELGRMNCALGYPGHPHKATTHRKKTLPPPKQHLFSYILHHVQLLGP
ncbi:hypothetical protein B0T14DRAFT_87408 [Immersiella caudata]|uniref:Uncharacterized protein n=1 Tax=Immersiella caudata TaxID=314043 RepID=A0AA40CDA7_9PEZI|nr:hypothetical protein B0T14DRAFT_87408 [Immersiella caudata]